MRVHIVYPFDPTRHAAPWSIGNALASAFRKDGWTVSQYDWEKSSAPEPMGGDIIIGHPHDSGAGPFISALDRQWRGMAAIAPWNGSEEYTRRLNQVASWVDRFFPIAGPRWKLPAWWQATRLDMAISHDHYPTIKRQFSPPGKRRFLYIGCTLPCKGTDYLAEVIKRAGGDWGHLGFGTIPGCTEHGYAPLEGEYGRQLVAGYDVLVCPGKNDANPTTVLEAGHIGLIPIVTPTCGWDFVPLMSGTDADQAAQALRALNQMDNRRLEEMQQTIVRWSEGYTWDRFTAPVLAWVRGIRDVTSQNRPVPCSMDQRPESSYGNRYSSQY